MWCQYLYTICWSHFGHRFTSLYSLNNCCLAPARGWKGFFWQYFSSQGKTAFSSTTFTKLLNDAVKDESLPVDRKDVNLGEVCVFKQNHTWSLGKVLQFLKYKNKTLSSQQYKGCSASVNKNAMGCFVLGSLWSKAPKNCFRFVIANVLNILQVNYVHCQVLVCRVLQRILMKAKV